MSDMRHKKVTKETPQKRNYCHTLINEATLHNPESRKAKGKI